MQAESMRIRGRIERKSAYLHELQSQVLHYFKIVLVCEVYRRFVVLI